MGTLLISKIREEYPDRMMMVRLHTHIAPCPALRQTPQSDRVLAMSCYHMVVFDQYLIPFFGVIQTFSVVPSPKVSSIGSLNLNFQ